MVHGVQIDTDGVSDFATGMQTQESGLETAAHRGADLHAQGVGFGARITTSSVITDAKQRYAQALSNTEANLRSYHLAAGVLARAAAEISAVFAAADLTSEQAHHKVQALMDDAARVAEEVIR